MHRNENFGVAITIFSIAVSAADAGTPRENRFAWAENVGWINFEGQPAGEGRVRFLQTGLAGYAWGENIGWINVGQCGVYRPADDQGPAGIFDNDPERFGVRVEGSPGDALRPLSGWAWGENVGWINFNTWDLGTLDEAGNPAGARVEGDRLRGYAWAENIGWINFDDDEHFVSVTFACSVADLANPQGLLDLADVIAFVESALGDAGAADVDCNGLFDLSDVTRFVTDFNAGCP